MFWSIVMETSIGALFGEAICWIIDSLFVIHGIVSVLGELFMAIFRVLCIKYQKIGINIQLQQQISHQLLFLEWIIMVLFIGFRFIGVYVSGTTPILAFCHGHSMEMETILKKAEG